MYAQPFWGSRFFGGPYWPPYGPGSVPPGPDPQPSTPASTGAWRIDNWQIGSPRASVALRDLRSLLKTVLPLNVFTRDEYPNASEDTIGKPIPIGYGKVNGATAYPVNLNTNTFKVFDHPVPRFTGFYTDKAEAIIPDSVDLNAGTFVWSGWAGETLYADAELADENPVDVVRLLLNSPVRGASVSLDDLDTASTGKGFGTGGARTHYVYGTVPTEGNREATAFAIGLYLQEAKEVLEWIQEVLISAYLIMYLNRDGKYQIKAWRPVPAEGLPLITENQIVTGSVAPRAVATDPVTLARVRYGVNHGLDGSQVLQHSNEELRQLRSLGAHAVLDKTLPLSDKLGAQYWAERAVAMRGVPRRTVALKVTREFTLLEPGDYVRLRYPPLQIDSVWEILSTVFKPGSSVVDLELIDVRGFKDTPGFWTPPAGTFAFPDELGGATITVWNNAWTDAQKQWYRENWGVWTNSNGYAETGSGALLGFRPSLWV